MGSGRHGAAQRRRAGQGACCVVVSGARAERRVTQEGLKAYYKAKIEEAELAVRNKTQNLRRLEAQRNELNSKGTRSYPGGRFRKRLTRQPPGPPQCVCCARSCRCFMSRGRTWARW